MRAGVLPAAGSRLTQDVSDGHHQTSFAENTPQEFYGVFRGKMTYWQSELHMRVLQPLGCILCGENVLYCWVTLKHAT